MNKDLLEIEDFDERGNYVQSLIEPKLSKGSISLERLEHCLEHPDSEDSKKLSGSYGQGSTFFRIGFFGGIPIALHQSIEYGLSSAEVSIISQKKVEFAYLVAKLNHNTHIDSFPFILPVSYGIEDSSGDVNVGFGFLTEDLTDWGRYSFKQGTDFNVEDKLRELNWNHTIQPENDSKLYRVILECRSNLIVRPRDSQVNRLEHTSSERCLSLNLPSISI